VDESPQAFEQAVEPPVSSGLKAHGEEEKGTGESEKQGEKTCLILKKP
jgi:hypothetical protein